MRRQRSALLLFLIICRGGFAQDTAAIWYAKKITPENTRPYLEVLTADSLEGRETGKPGQKKAAAFIANHFQSIGLQPAFHGGYFQHTSLSARATAGKNFEVNEKNFVFMRDYFYPDGFEDTLIVLDTIVFAGYGISTPAYDDYKGVNANGRGLIFLISANSGPAKQIGPPTKYSLAYRLRLAELNGARLVIIMTDSLDQIVDAQSYGLVPPIHSTIPYAFVSGNMAKSFFQGGLEKKFVKAGRKIAKRRKPASFVFACSAKLNFVKNTDVIRGENVLGFLEGTDKKEEVLVLTAHYDHLGIRDSLIYHGADDDGSGTTAVMAMAKQFADAAREGHRPRRSILFMTVSGEEKGLLGSKYYVKHPVVPLANTIADLNTDMIGRTDPKHDSLKERDYVYIIGSDKLSSELHAISEQVNAGFEKLELDYTFNRPDDPNRFYYRSDHYNFAKNKIPVIFYFNGSHADYHKPSDTIEKIQFDLLAKRTRLIFLTAWELANREGRIKVDVVSDMPDKKEE